MSAKGRRRHVAGKVTAGLDAESIGNRRQVFVCVHYSRAYKPGRHAALMCSLHWTDRTRLCRWSDLVVSFLNSTTRTGPDPTRPNKVRGLVCDPGLRLGSPTESGRARLVEFGQYRTYGPLTTFTFTRLLFLEACFSGLGRVIGEVCVCLCVNSTCVFELSDL